MIEETNPELTGFFSLMVNAIIPKDRSAYNKQEAKKSVVALSIDTLSSIGYSACAKTVTDFQKKIQTNHTAKIDRRLPAYL
ncbi:hypothetical protein C1646_777068 [Rhizophagus diaphanus]|nr:hypothetical protein C1646_777068 [Rhizophagus diaphanus] [Rhizophagus sp. MUCL 43196]